LPEAKDDDRPATKFQSSSNKVSRRKFLTYLGIAGGAAAIGGAAYLTALRQPSPGSIQPAQGNQTGITKPATPRRPLTIAEPKNPQNYTPEEYLEFIRWMQSVSDKVSGKQIRIALEAEVGPRALYRNKIDFETATGMTLLLEFDVYQNNLAKTLLAVATKSPTFDVMNVDISQVGRFKDHLIPIEELSKRYPDLTYPKLDFDDFEPMPWNSTSKYPPDLSFAPYNRKYQGTRLQIPQETPIQIRFYRKDMYNAEKRSLPITWDEYYEDVKYFHQPLKAQFGTVLMAARFPSIIMEWHNHLYSFGGKLWNINEDGITSAVDSDEAIASLENYARLNEYAEPNSRFYGWAPAAEAMAQGRAVNMINFTEYADLMDIQGESVVIRKVGFDKNPKGAAGQSHHYSGAGLSIPKYSRNPEAAWLFMQWATVAATQVVVALDPLAYAVPTRKSVFNHPEVQRVISEGSIRHFTVARDVLDANTINFKPGFPNWDQAEGVLMTNMNKVMYGEITPRQALKEAKAHIDNVGKFSF
jgi:multiple sugar transport system substrate-binding protein